MHWYINPTCDQISNLLLANGGNDLSATIFPARIKRTNSNRVKWAGAY